MDKEPNNAYAPTNTSAYAASNYVRHKKPRNTKRIVAIVIASVCVCAVIAGLLVYAFMPRESSNANVYPQGPLIINEATLTNDTSAVLPNGDVEDWIELKNIGTEALNLADYALSDDETKLEKRTLPAYQLNPGECVMLYTDSEEAEKAGFLAVSFSMNSDGETLYLQDAKGNMIDQLAIPADTPPDGSYGRMSATETKEGAFGKTETVTVYKNFYFVNPTPGEENVDGWERVSAKVVDTTPAGVYDNVESIQVELSSPGTIYYTTNGTLPTAKSAVYDGPITLTKTTVIRAFCAEEGALPSRVRNLTYLINEHHSLPVISISIDNMSNFNKMYTQAIKNYEVAGSASFYENGSLAWERACGVFMKGWTSLNLDKKSMGIEFGAEYGDGKLHYDVFNTGVSTYKSLSLHAGQDYQFAIIRTELCQNLVLQTDSRLYTQHGTYCVLYIDGEYRGIYCLKEDLSKSSFANDHNVKKSSVTSVPAMDFNTNGTKGIDEKSANLGQYFYQYAFDHDMTDPANYAEYCKHVDIETLIDYFLFEGWCANSDTLNNMRYFKSSELGDLWQPCFYDLDWSFYYPANNYANIYNGRGNASPHMAQLMHVLFENTEFRMAVLTRFELLNRTTLSNANVLAEIDRLAAQIDSEVTRDHKLYGMGYDEYTQALNSLKNWFIGRDWAQRNRENLTTLIGYTQAEWDQAIAAVDAMLAQ